MVKSLFISISLSIFIRLSECAKLQPKVIHGEIANINKFPHSVFLYAECLSKTVTMSWRCGSSILNQNVLLTACHCLSSCENQIEVMAIVGDMSTHEGISIFVKRYECNNIYNPREKIGDIAVMILKKPLHLNDKVKRLAILKEPPYKEKAEVAGWGIINEIGHKRTELLYFVKQYVKDTNSCKKIIPTLPMGVICAATDSEDSYLSSGDSGSALVVRGYIQIGIASYRNRHSLHTTVYTDIGHYYNWIQTTVMRLICDE